MHSRARMIQRAAHLERRTRENSPGSAYNPTFSRRAIQHSMHPHRHTQTSSGVAEEARGKRPGSLPGCTCLERHSTLRSRLSISLYAGAARRTWACRRRRWHWRVYYATGILPSNWTICTKTNVIRKFYPVIWLVALALCHALVYACARTSAARCTTHIDRFEGNRALLDARLSG